MSGPGELSRTSESLPSLSRRFSTFKRRRESHYAAYVADAMDDLAAKAIIPLTTASDEVIPLRPRGAR
jgi:hypothetical protein